MSLEYNGGPPHGHLLRRGVIQYKNYKERIVNNAYYSNVFRPLTVCVAMLIIAACGQEDRAPAPADEAETSAQVPITTSSTEARALYLQGRALLDDLHFVEANEVFIAAVDKDPEFAMGHFMVATTSQTAAEFFDAVAAADASKESASEGEQLYIEALVAASENNQAEQLDALKQLVAMYPQDERPHMQLGNYMNGQQDFAAAVEHYKHAMTINPEFAAAYNALGYAYRSLDDLDSARAAFQEYVKLIPDEANPHDSFAELLMEMGNYDESIEHYRMSLKIDPNFTASYAGINVNYSLMGEAELAQEAADQMLAAARNLTERQAAMFRSVTAHLFAGNTEAAMEVCDTMAAEAEVKGDHAAVGSAHEYMGDIMLAAGNAAEAERHFNEALDHRLHAEINEANKALAERTHMFKTAIAAMIGDNAEAAASLTAEYGAAAEASGTAFEKRRIHELAGFLAMFDEDNESAAAHFDQASQLNPVVLYWSAVVNKELGNTEKAIDLATRAANRNTLSGNLPFFRADALRLLEELSAG